MKIYPPIVLALALVTHLCLWYFSLGVLNAPQAVTWAGFALIVIGLSLGFTAIRAIFFVRTTIRPYEESSYLLKKGPYALSRNPIYLGMAIILIGVTFLTRSWPGFAVDAIFVWIINTTVVRVEERMLAEGFGAEYAAYCDQVRRWL